MQQKRRREGLIRSDRSFEPKRYIQTAVGFIARVGRNRVIVANGASRPRRIDLSPRTIVCRAGHPVPRKRELVVGAAARVLYVATDQGCLAVLVELLGQADKAGARLRPSARAVALTVYERGGRGRVRGTSRVP